jgi:hypothetical protein
MLPHSTEVNVGSQKLLIYTTTEKRGNGNVKFGGIHVVDQVDQNLFSTALPQIMDQK